MTKKKPLKRKIKVALKRKSKIFKRSITKKKDLISKKFNTSIKGKKIDIGKSVKNFFDWVKGAEIVELPNCNTNEDPVRPELDNDFRTSFGRKIYGVKYQDEIHAVMCFALKEVFKKIKKTNHLNRLVTLSPLTDMARKFHLSNGAIEIGVNETTQNFEYKM